MLVGVMARPIEVKYLAALNAKINRGTEIEDIFAPEISTSAVTLFAISSVITGIFSLHVEGRDSMIFYRSQRANNSW